VRASWICAAADSTCARVTRIEGYWRTERSTASESVSVWPNVLQASAVQLRTLTPFDNLTKELPHLNLGGGQRFSPGRSGPVQPPYRAANALRRGLQIPLAFQSVQQRVQCSRTKRVPVARQFFGHLETKYRLFRGVVQDMQPDQSGV